MPFDDEDYGFGTAAAEDKTEQAFDSLEERIFETERDDDEVRTTVRIHDWMMAGITRISKSINTSTAEVVAKAYISGLRDLRSVTNNYDYEELDEMATIILQIVTDNFADASMERKVVNLVVDTQIDIQRPMPRSLDHRIHLPISESVMSEVDDNYCSVISTKSPVHRAILTLGVSNSRNRMTRANQLSEHYEEEIIRCTEDYRENIEEALWLLMSNIAYIRGGDGIDDEVVNSVERLLEMCKTEKGEACRRLYYGG